MVHASTDDAFVCYGRERRHGGLGCARRAQPTSSVPIANRHRRFVLRQFNTHLVIVDLDLAEDVVLDEALEDGAVDLSEELTRVHRVLCQLVDYSNEHHSQQSIIIEHITSEMTTKPLLSTT